MAGVNFSNFHTVFRVNFIINHVLFSRDIYEKGEKENFRNSQCGKMKNLLSTVRKFREFSRNQFWQKSRESSSFTRFTKCIIY